MGLVLESQSKLNVMLVEDKNHIFMSALCCDSRTKPVHDKFQKGPSWKLMSKGEREITSKLNTSYRGRKREYSGGERSPGGENTQEESNSKGSQMLGVQEERCHMSSRGGRKTCSYVLILH